MVGNSRCKEGNSSKKKHKTENFTLHKWKHRPDHVSRNNVKDCS